MASLTLSPAHQRRARSIIAAFTIAVSVCSSIFGFPSSALAAYQSSDVLGQPDFTSSTANTLNLGVPNQYGMNLPQDTVVDPVNHRLFVAEQGNNRVLVYNLDVNDVPLDHAADFVLGQPDFQTKNSNLNQNSFDLPVSVTYASASERLFVSDLGNQRVLVFDVASITNGEDAVNVLGQDDFTSNSPGSAMDQLNNANGIDYDSVNNRLFVADGGNTRVLVFDVVAITDGEPAVNVLGQIPVGDDWTTSFDTAGADIFSMTTDSTNGVIYVGTGGPGAGTGTIYRCDTTTLCDAAGDWTVSFATTEDAIEGLIFEPATGVIYAGTATNGIIYRCDTTTDCDDAGDWTVSFDTPEGVITFFTTDATNGIIYAGTTNNGIIYRCDTTTACDDAGDWTVSFDTPENAIHSLAVDATNGIIYAGTANNGIIYRCDTTTACDDAGDWTVSFDTPENGVGNLTIDTANGVIYAGTAFDATIYRCDTTTDCDDAGDWTVSFATAEIVIYSLTIDTTNHTIYAGTAANGIIYRCDTTTACDDAGDWTTSFDATESVITSLTVDTTNGVIYAGTDTPGIIYRCDTSTGCDTPVPMTSPNDVAYDAVNDRLFVSEGSGGNRVLVFDTTVLVDNENPVRVLGQADFVSTGATTTQSGFDAPIGVAFDANNDRLFVSDNNNSRVTVFDTSAITNGENAINVLGQDNFTSNGQATTADGLNIPARLSYDTLNDHVFVADQLNNRVMVFDADPAVLIANNAGTDGPDAVDVLGQLDSNGDPTFTQDNADNQDSPVIAAVTAGGFSGPDDALVDTIHHRLFVVDRGNNRVLVFNLDSDNTLVDHTADFVLGQLDFFSNGAQTTQDGLDMPRAVAYDSDTDRLFVAEENNNRVLVFNVATITNGEDAIAVIGQDDFITATANTTQDGFSGPIGITYDEVGDRLFVAEYLNSRVMVFDAAVIDTVGEDAFRVLGQEDFVTGAGGLDQDSLDGSVDVAYDASGNRLFVMDGENSRVMVFDVTTIDNGEDAVSVLGQLDFDSEVSAVTQSNFNNGSGVEFDAALNRLFVTEGNNHRVMVFDVATITNGENAVAVVGQDDFTSNVSGTTDENFSNPNKSSWDPTQNRLYVADTTNNRVMIFDFVRITATSMPNGSTGNAYSQTVPTEDSQGTMSFAVTGGSLPPGLSLNSSTGEISGTPTTAGAYAFTVTVQDDNGSYGIFVDQQGLTMTITATPASSLGSTPDTTPFGFGVDGGSSLVNTVAIDGSTLYVGGDFQYAGRVAQKITLVSKLTDDAVLDFPYTDGTVRTAVSDGFGGWYIGGDFTRVGTFERFRLAHILSDGTVDPSFDPNADGNVIDLLLDGTTLYAGGNFNTVNGGTTRIHIAAFDTTTGTATTFDPNVDGGVNTLLLDGTTLYVGGQFSAVNGGLVRNCLASFDTTTGTATAFDPSVSRPFLGNGCPNNAYVLDLALDGSTLYAGGYFSEVNGGTTRNCVAAFDTATSIATAFDPNVGNCAAGGVFGILLDGTTLYAGGNFADVNGGTPRNGLAAFDTNTSIATAFDPNLSGGSPVALMLDSTTLYVGGTFTGVNGGIPRSKVAAFDTTTSIATAFDPSVSGAVTGFADEGSNLLLVGEFNLVDSVTRNNLAAFNVDDGTVTAFDPNTNSSVATLVTDGVTVYAGGNFTTVNGGATRNFLAGFDAATGTATSFDPNMNGAVYASVLDGTTLYAGGAFTDVNGGTTRNYLAAFDVGTSIATAFDPNLDSETHALSLDGAMLYVGGYFTTVNGGTTRNYLAAFDTGTSIASAFDPNLGGPALALALDSTTVYVGGTFTTVNGGTTRNSLAAFDTGTSVATSFDPNPNNPIQALALDGATLYAGGGFTTVNGGTLRRGAAAFDTTTGIANSFNPNLDNTVYALILDNGTLYAGGSLLFANGGGVALQGLAVFSPVAPSPTPTPTPTPTPGGGGGGIPGGGPTPTPSVSPTPLVSPGVQIEFGAENTKSHFVTLSFKHPFSSDAGVSMRPVNANQLTPADRDIVAGNTAGRASTGANATPATDQRASSSGVPELSAGTARPFTPTIQNWDLCAGAFRCDPGEYRVYVQYYQTASGSLGVLAALGDTVSPVYTDTIIYGPSATQPGLPATGGGGGGGGGPVFSATPVPSAFPSPSVTPSATPTTSPSPIASSVQQFISAIGQAFSNAINALVQAAPVAAPIVTAIVIVPVALALGAALAAGNAAAAAMFMAQSLLQIFGLKRRAKVWGTVYDAKTKYPVPFARVELRDQANRTLEVRYADRDGRYGFLTSPTSVHTDVLLCSMVPSAKGYVFPSVLVLGDPDFIVYNHIYRGEPLSIRADQLVNFNIPLDPVSAQASTNAIKSSWTYSSKLGAAIMNVAFWIGVVILPLNAILHPSVLTIALVVAFILANAARVGTHFYRPHGLVVDSTTGQPLPYALVTLNEPNGRRLAFAVSDDQGRYFLVTDPGSYLLISHTPAQIQPARDRSELLTTKKGWINRKIAL